jgi:RimJ/RimL family protein N-acetyltransferase
MGLLKDEIIYTERLKGVPMNMEHLKYFLEYYDENAAFYMDLISSGDMKKNTEEFIKQSIKELEEETDLHIIIFNKDDDDFIGYFGVYYLKDDKPEIGMWIRKEKQNKGYAREAFECAVKWIKENINFSDIRCPIDRKNIFSRKLPERLAGKIVKEYVTMSCTGRELDIVEYWINYEDVMNFK